MILVCECVVVEVGTGVVVDEVGAGVLLLLVCECVVVEVGIGVVVDEVGAGVLLLLVGEDVVVEEVGAGVDVVINTHGPPSGPE